MVINSISLFSFFCILVERLEKEWIHDPEISADLLAIREFEHAIYKTE